MGRGDDQTNSKALPRRNLFRRQIKLSGPKEAQIKLKEARDEAAREPIRELLRDAGLEERTEVAFTLSRDEARIRAARQELFRQLELDRNEAPFWSVAHMLDDFGGIDTSEYSLDVYLHNPEAIYYVLKGERDYPPDNLRGGYVSSEKLMEAIRIKRENLAVEARSSFVRAAAQQKRVAEVLRESRIDDFSKNSPAGELLLDIAEKDLFSPNGVAGAYFLPEAYRREVTDPSYGQGKIWRVYHPFTGRVMHEGRAETEEEGQAAADAAALGSHGKYIKRLKEKEKVFKKRKNIFAGLDAVVGENRLSPPSVGSGKTNLAVDFELEGLKRKDLEEGYSIVVGQRIFRTPEPQNTLQRAVDITGIASFAYKKKEDLILIFKDGKMIEEISSGFAKDFSSKDKPLGRSSALVKEAGRRIAAFQKRD